MIIGVIGKAVKAIVGGVSKGVGKKVEGHIDLKTETYLSGEWLRGLIKNSETKEELNQISEYLYFRTNTLLDKERYLVINQLNAKLKTLKDSEIIDKLLEFIKHHGEDLL